MGWEQRSRGGSYYVRKRREGVRVKSEYVGTGLIGMLAAELDAEEQATELAERDARCAEQERWAESERVVGEVCTAADEIARAALVLSGFHQHHRGEWRRRRESRQE
jgi:hypothetical protein